MARLVTSRVARGLGSDLVALLVAMLDVWLAPPDEAPGYATVLSWVAIAAMVMRRHVPFLAVLVTVPGFFVGWSQLAAMIALGTLANRYMISWKTAVGAVLVWVCRFVAWPWDRFTGQTWREHALNGLYGVLVAGMPIAIGFLVTIRRELADRVVQLARSREREQALYAEAVRSSERAKIAREMHDVVSHNVSLIAMQAGALRVSSPDEQVRSAAELIRQLGTKTLEELRELVGALRSGEDDEAMPDLDDLGELVSSSDQPVSLTVDAGAVLPAEVSRAAYRTVQEALTNARKYAVGAPASVLVQRDQGSLRVEVRNEPARLRASTLPSGGHGLRGLQERAVLLGGQLDFGPTSDGGFQVRATYPV